jgi:hypothetical protein
MILRDSSPYKDQAIPSRSGHVVCDSFRDFLFTALSLTTLYNCSCLTNDGILVSQSCSTISRVCYDVCRDTEAFLRALSLTFAASLELTHRSSSTSDITESDTRVYKDYELPLGDSAAVIS